MRPTGLHSCEVYPTPIESAIAAAEAQAPEEGLATVAVLRGRLESLEALHVERAVRAGWSWRRIADVLGVSKQAVHKKHARRVAERLAEEVSPERRRLVVTGHARQAVRFAREEADALGAGSVRPEHLLLGLLRDDRGPAVAALASAGVSLAAARRAAEADGPGDGAGSERSAGERLPVSPEARAVMEQSLREAVRRGDGHLGVEHLLLALLRDDDGPAIRILRAVGADPDSLERLVDEAIGRAD